MLWAAWADALGWISELTTAENFRRRTQGRALTEPFAWERNIGGRSGPRVKLPAGCYSDDTQLRLATARAISSAGFDVEAFSRVELPVWQSYALGGGRSTKAASASMAKQTANWAANFYSGWEKSGGNGAAMRIQPHVYASPDLQSYGHIDDVIKNSIVTHGHPNALVGAVLHAAALTVAMAEQRPPGPDNWNRIIEVAHESFEIFNHCAELAAYWRPRWESVTGRRFDIEWHNTVDHAKRLLYESVDAYDALHASRNDRVMAGAAYELLVRVLSLDDARTVGNGLTTSIAAIVLAGALPDHPAQSAQLSAARLNTDTDTIATMAAAIVGALSPAKLPSPLLDIGHITTEARRLAAISFGEETAAFPYPDLLKWTAPKSALDSLGVADSKLAVSGLGWVHPFGDVYVSKLGNWQWMTTSFGPTLLLKHRVHIPDLPLGNWPVAPTVGVDVASSRGNPRTSAQSSLFEDESESEPRHLYQEEGRRLNIRLILDWLDGRGYSDKDLGYAFRRVIERGTSSQLAEFTKEVQRAIRRDAGDTKH
ncbi:ADP-ribosylglycohydrolase family protein [Nocardia puris]|nr:ADP-ribosylglycohydrolase family protein [Nocardia puris]